MLPAEVFRRDLRKLGLCTGLELFAARLLHVADAGSLGGGMLSNLAGPNSPSVFSFVLDPLLLRLSILLSELSFA